MTVTVREPEALATELPPETKELSPRKSRHSWRDKFRVAFRGLKLGIRGHSSFFVHFFFTALVLAAGTVFRCTQIEWVMLLFCIGLVLTTELVNSSIETFFRGLDDATKNRAWPALDIAAGAVLLASFFAALIGLILFIPKLVIWLEIPS
jgi:diacylglycerol kinase